MKSFILRHFYILLPLSLLLLIGVVFYAGYLEGKSGQGEGVVLSCSETTLESLTIPVSDLAAGSLPKKINPEDLTASTTKQQGVYMGSKNGTKYYKPTCPNAKRIKPENRVWFESIEDATLQGYTPGKC